MKKEKLFAPIREKYDELKNALKGTDIRKIRELTLEVHAMVHPAEISGRTEKTIADYVLEYMLMGNQNEIVPREDYDVDLHYAGTRRVPMCWQFWHTYRIEDLVSNILMVNQNQIFNKEWQKKIGASIIDTGNALEFDEAVAFGKGLNILALRDYMIAVGKNTRCIIRKFNIGSNTVYGSGRMGNESIGGRWCDYRFSLRMAAGILGKTDEGRYDFNSYDRSSYDALASLSE